MHVRARCANSSCAAYGIDKTIVVGQLGMFRNQRNELTCAHCRQVMKIMKATLEENRLQRLTQTHRERTRDRWSRYAGVRARRRNPDPKGKDLLNKWSGREDSNLRPPGPEPRSGTY